MRQMSAADKISYLANVFLVCGADGFVGTEEVDVLRDVTRRLGVSHAEAVSARNLAAAPGFECVSLSDSKLSQSNLVDMVMVALADGTIHKDESAPIERLAKRLRYAQADMDMIATRA